MKLTVSTISPTIRFLPDLAAGIFELAGGMGPDLTRFRILLPTRRACRELQKEFLNLSGGKPLLLPRMHPLGDIDQEELDLMIAGTVEADMADALPPALSSLERQMMLTQLVQARDPDMRGEQCLSLARALGRLMDQVYTEDLNLSDLPTLVDSADLSQHWGETVEFLTILSEAWPKVLEIEGRIDSADRRNRLLKRLASFWQEHPPQTPIIAAGSTGSIPATGNLLHVIAGLPLGHVILPGLDLDMGTESWDNIGETHPQNTMKRLIARMALPRHQVRNWREAKPAHSYRLEIARASTCPAQTCDQITIPTDDLIKGLENVALLEADNSRHEAQLIALAVRECLETPGRTAVIITPDRNLARRISSSLKRWSIAVDDSAGLPLHMKPIGIFFNKILSCIAQDFAPLPLIDLLKTAYLQKTLTTPAIENFEIRVLRGPRPASGFEGLHSHIAKLKNNDDLQNFVNKLEVAFAPLLPFAKKLHLLADLVPALISVAENFAAGEDNLWTSVDGEALSILLSELQDAKSSLADLSTHMGYLSQFMSERKIRSVYGTHPRVTILGQIEARLISADLMIMAGLNEGTWPPEPPADPWMSRPMRKKFGLPPIERQTGLSAHDFVQAFNAPEVILTRARKMDGTPTVPARWLERLSALLETANLKKEFLTAKAESKWMSWLDQLDAPDIVTPILKPDPMPPVSARPKELGVTGIEKLMRNPYEIYARYILKLRPLDPIDQDVTASERGEFIHHILNEFVSAYPRDLPANSEVILLDMGRARLSEMGHESPEWAYWWPRFENLVPAFLEEERKWRMNSSVWKTEIKGSYKFNDLDFTLTAKADRIDAREERAAIIDYKTGSAPSRRDVINGKSPQLSLEAMLLTKRAFEDKFIDANHITLGYWILTGKKDPIEIVSFEGYKPKGWDAPLEISDLITNAEKGFKNLMQAFMSEVTPYTPIIPNSTHLFDDQKAYKHLARCDEWGIEGESDSGEDAA